MSIDNRSIQVSVGRPTVEAAEQGTNGTDERVPQQRAITPLIDIYEGPEGLILEADLPGAAEDQVQIQLEDNVLVLNAKVPSRVPEGGRLLHEEYRVGDFSRAFILSDEVERSAIRAELRNGVLRLTLPKAERAKTRRIEIKS